MYFFRTMMWQYSYDAIILIVSFTVASVANFRTNNLHHASEKIFKFWTVGNWSSTGPEGVIDMIAAALAHVALTKCKWRHPSNCRQKGSRGQLSDRRLQDRLKPNYPFVSSGRSINPTRLNVRADERENVARESRSRFLTSICVYSESPRKLCAANWKKVCRIVRTFRRIFEGGH